MARLAYDAAKLAAEIFAATEMEDPGGELDQKILRKLVKLGVSMEDEVWRRLSEPATVWINAGHYSMQHDEEVPAFDDVAALERAKLLIEEEDAKVARAEAAQAEKLAQATQEETDVRRPVIEKKAAKPSPKATAKTIESKTVRKAARVAPATKALGKAIRVASRAAARAEKKTRRRGNGRTRVSRPRIQPDAVIRVLLPDYPFRAGSNHAKVLALYKKGMTVADFAKACRGKPWKRTPIQALASHRRKGVIEIV